MLRIVQRFAGLDTQQHFLHGSVFPPEIVGIVGGSQRDFRFSGKPQQQGQVLQFLPNLVVLNLQIVVALAEQLLIPQGSRLCRGIVPCRQQTGHFSRQTAGQTN